MDWLNCKICGKAVVNRIYHGKPSAYCSLRCQNSRRKKNRLKQLCDCGECLLCKHRECGQRYRARQNGILIPKKSDKQLDLESIEWLRKVAKMNEVKSEDPVCKMWLDLKRIRKKFCGPFSALPPFGGWITGKM